MPRANRHYLSGHIWHSPILQPVPNVQVVQPLTNYCGPFQWFDKLTMSGVIVMPLRSVHHGDRSVPDVKTFNRCATFKTFNGLRIAEYFHVSGILETSKRSNKLNCHVDVRTHWK